MSFNEDIFIIDCWTDTISKENDLISLIKILKEFNIPILLAGHYPIRIEIQRMVDYYLFDKENPLLLNSEFEEHGVNSNRWTKKDNWYVENRQYFHHDYAIWTTMRNAFNFANYLGKKYIHFLEYDNLPDPYQYRQSFLEYSRNFDAVLYEYNKGSSTSNIPGDYCATFIFSMKTDIGLRMIDQIKTKKDYYSNRPDGWQLERVFLHCVREVTNNIFISKYIANNNELNTQSVWNRDGILRNGGVFQIYLAIDDNAKKLYLHFVSGFSDKDADKDYLVEINYGEFKRFYTIRKNDYSVLEIGDYRKGDVVKIFYLGVEVFNEFLDKTYDEFKEMNKIVFDTNKNNNSININFIDGAFVEILGDKDEQYKVEIIDNDTDKIEYVSILKNNNWARANKKFFVNWKIKITINNNIEEYVYNDENKNVLISFESKSIGDTIAWMAYVEEYRKKHNTNVICSTFHNDLFKEQYPEIRFVSPGTTVYNLYALYRIGVFYDNGEYDKNKHLSDPKKLPLQKIASDILGLEFKEIRTDLGEKNVKKKKQVSIAVHGTAQAKYWNNLNGFQDVVDFLRINGYKVLLLSKEENGYMGNKNPIGVEKINPGSINKICDILRESVLFIGISSGLSWLSWSVGTPTIIISGFTDEYVEPQEGITRIINKRVCHGCWGAEIFDPGNWNYCPYHEKTERQFECTKEITSEMVIFEIKNILKI